MTEKARTKDLQISFRASTTDKALLEELGEYYGVTQAGIIAMLLRDRARKLGYTIEKARVLRPSSFKPVTEDEG